MTERVALPVFRCERLACSLTVDACASRWTKANESGRLERTPDAAGIRASACRGCEVGAGNAGRREGTDVANQIEHKGLLLSVREWAERPEIKRLGLTEAALRMRLKKGWSVERALTTPKMSDGPKPKEKPEAPKEKPARAKPAPKVEVTMAAPVVTEAERIARFEAAVNVLNTLGWSCSMVATTPRGSVLVEISIPASAP